MSAEPIHRFETAEGAENFCKQNADYEQRIETKTEKRRGKGGSKTTTVHCAVLKTIAAAHDAANAARFTARPTSAFELPAATGRHLIKNVIDDGTEVIAIRAAPGAGKSHAAVEQAACIARGVPWHGHRTRQGSVVYVAAEGAKGIRRKRLPAFRQHHGLSATDLDAIRWIDEAPNLASTQDVDLLIKAIGRADATYIDTFAASYEGDENKKEFVDVALKNCKRIASATGGPVILVVHEGWAGDRVRGWSGQFAAYDVEIAIARDGDVRTVAITKAKDGEERTLFSFRLKQVVLGYDADGDAITSCVIEECVAPVAASSGKVQKMIEGYLLNRPDRMDTKENLIEQIAAQLPVSNKSKTDNREKCIRQALKRLTDDGVVEIDPADKSRVRLKNREPNPFDILEEKP